MQTFDWIILLFGLGTLAILFVLLRSVLLWFWRVDDIVKRLDRIAESNERIAQALTQSPPQPGSPRSSPPVPGQSAPGAPGPFPTQAGRA